MEKTFKIEDKEVILYPGTDKERNLTAEEAECELCRRNPGYGECDRMDDSFPDCEFFYIKRGWKWVGSIQGV